MKEHRKENSMTDKIQKILDKIQIRKLFTMDEHMAFYSKNAEADYKLLSKIEELIKSLQEEPVSEDLEDASRNYADDEEYGDDIYFAIKAAFKAGAKWQKEQIEEALLSEVLPIFMHGGEADEVVAKLDEVLSQKK